jgi:LuxR family maltose regulon positive regulatory protein
MPNTKRLKKALYFTERLKESFSTFLEYPCTVIEAPMGYGKTTAVIEALDSIDAYSIWQRVYDKGASEFWAGFCDAISKIDESCAKGLQNIGMLEDSLMKREVMLLIETMHIEKATFLVIDDYHYVKSEVADAFLRLLILNMPKNLHLVIISRISFLDNSSELQLKGVINHIGANTMEFSLLDIKKYFRLLDIIIGKEEQEQLYKYSEGWVSALYLFAMDYKLHGSFVFTSSIPELVYQTVYEPLGDELKSFLKTICLFETFNLEQAQYMWQKDNTKELLDQLLSCNAFITQDRITSYYSFHNIFSLCIREQFYQQPETMQRTIWTRMGELHLGNKIDSMECFYNAKEYDGMLTALEEDRQKSIYNEKKEMLFKYYRECPIEAKNRHPLAILVYAVLLVTQFRERELYEEACREFFQSIENNETLSSDERDQLLGEYEVMQTFTAYNDLIKIGEHNEKAYQLLKAPPRFVNTKNSFTFGSPSILYLYYRESGKLSELIKYLKQATSYYAKNTKGHGSCYKYVFEAEWYYFMGDFENAIHKALPMAKEAEQADIVLCGLFFLSRISMARGDFPKVLKLLGQMDNVVKHEVKQNQSYWLVYTFDICKAYIYACLRQTDEIPKWIYEYEYPKHMHFLSISFANLVYGKALLTKGSLTQFLGVSEQFMKQASIFPNLLAIVYTDIYIAIANYKLSRVDACHTALKEALDIAMPDNLVMPFVENAKELINVFDILCRENIYGDFLRKIKYLYEKYNKSIQKIVNEYFKVELPLLTEREKKIAFLVLEGMNNKKIASELYISPNTVKLELKNIFRKLNINSRVLLKKENIV